MEKKTIWVHQVTFQIRKEISSGDVEKKINELGESVEILSVQKQKLLEEPVSNQARLVDDSKVSEYG